MTPDGVAELRSRLASHVAGDDTEARALAAVLRLLDAPDPFSALVYHPGHITASAFVLHPSAAAVALILHAKLARWLQPGGHVEADDDTIVAAAVREVGEETGLDPAEEPWLCDVDVHAFPARGAVPRHLHHDVRLAFRAADDRLRAGHGVEDVRWFTFDEALGLDESIARPVRRLLPSARN